MFLVISALLARVLSVDGAEQSAITDLVQGRGAAATPAPVVAADRRLRGSAACRARADGTRPRSSTPGRCRSSRSSPRPASRSAARSGTARVAWLVGQLAADRPVRARPARRQRASGLPRSSCSRSASDQERRRLPGPVLDRCGRPHRPTGGLARGPPLARGQQLGQAAGLAQPDSRPARRPAAGSRPAAASGGSGGAFGPRPQPSSLSPSERRLGARAVLAQRGDQQHARHTPAPGGAPRRSRASAERRPTWKRLAHGYRRGHRSRRWSTACDRGRYHRTPPMAQKQSTALKVAAREPAARAPPVACAARATSPASSTAAARTRSPSRSRPASCGWRWPTPAPCST